MVRNKVHAITATKGIIKEHQQMKKLLAPVSAVDNVSRVLNRYLASRIVDKKHR